MKRTPRKKTVAIAKSSIANREDAIFSRVATILDEARAHVARTINTAMVHAYWLIGREIIEVEQHGAGRAAYGEELLKKLAGYQARAALRQGLQPHRSQADAAVLPGFSQRFGSAG